MYKTKQPPVGATPRVCGICGQGFGYMTDASWSFNYHQHELMNLRHKRAVEALHAKPKR